METTEMIASNLLSRTQGSELTIDALLAFLAYSLHEDTDLLLGAREKGAEIGAVGQHAHRVVNRAEDILT